MRFALASRRFRVVWAPVALHWRRKRKPLTRQRALPHLIPAAVSNTTWLAHFHLHFSALTRERSRCEERRAFSPATVTREVQRLVTNRHATVFRAAAMTMRPRGAYRPPSVISAGNVVVRNIAVPAAGHTHPRPLPVTPRVPARRVRPLFHDTARKVFRAVTSKDERTPPIERRTCIVSRELRLVHLRSSVVRHSREESAAPPPRARFHRAPEIVWRSAPGQPQAQVVNESAPPSPRMPRPSIAAQETAPEPPRRAARAALQAQDIDGALLDRLTDDVIRRVERRVRIERERRGL
jgi:hypothetical protein